MARLGKTLLFEKRVRDALLEHLPVGFCADATRPARIVRFTEWGEQDLRVRRVKGSIDLFFGVIFKSFAVVDQLAGTALSPQWGDRAFSMDSGNMRQMKGLPYVQRFPLNLKVIDETTDEGYWSCHAYDPPYAEHPPARIAQRMIGFLGGVVLPFFERFSSLHAVRESLVNDDGWLLGFGRHQDVLLIDIALNDKAHFHEYVRVNRDDQNFAMALEKLPMLIEKFPDFAFEAPRVEQGAAPNGGPATQLGNSGVTEGPPSVS